MSTPITIGVAGHVDHGKTTLVRALTGIDTDRKAEEKARGLSIESGVAELKLPSGRSVALIDVPGHTDFLKNTIRGLNSVDMAILVVAADDGVMPQTREHVDILKSFNARSGLVVLSKTDLVDEETLELAELELSELLGGTFLDQQPILKFSHQKPEFATAIINGVDEALSDLSAKKSDQPFRMWIDQVRSIQGHGTVVSGTVTAGMVRCNDEMALLPSGLKTRARSLESHACAVSRAVAGQRVGINLHRVPVADVRRGMSLATPETLHPVYLIDVQMAVMATTQRGIKNRQRVKIFIGTSITNGMVVLMDRERLEPGETGLAQIRLLRPVAAQPRDAFVISPLNINTVIAGGRVLQTPREKFRAVKAGSVVPLLRTLEDEDVEAYVERVFDSTKGCPINAKMLSQKTGLPSSRFERRINAKVQKGEWVYLKGCGAIKKDHLRALEAQCRKVIEKAFQKDPLKKKITLAEVAERLDHRAAPSVLQTVAESLCKAGRIAPLEGGFVLCGFRPSLDDHRETLISHLLAHALESGLTPFSADTFWKLHRPKYEKKEVQQLLNYLSSQKKLVRLNDRRFLSPDAVEEIKARVARTIEARSFVTVGDCRELLGYGRWGGTHVLDYLNEIGFTVRRDNKHYLNKEGR
ncbi:MAG: selenocysteine-specific translation elongation factor [Desulfobacteraceae bacterium]